MLVGRQRSTRDSFPRAHRRRRGALSWRHWRMGTAHARQGSLQFTNLPKLLVAALSRSGSTRSDLTCAFLTRVAEVAVKSRCIPTPVTRLQHQQHHRNPPNIEACEHTATRLSSAREEKLSGTTHLQHDIPRELRAFARPSDSIDPASDQDTAIRRLKRRMSRKGADRRANGDRNHISSPASESSSGHQHSPHSLSADLEPTSTCTSHRHSDRRKRKSTNISPQFALCALLASSIPTTMAQNCVKSPAM